jgi:hypothetical protein
MPNGPGIGSNGPSRVADGANATIQIAYLNIPSRRLRLRSPALGWQKQQWMTWSPQGAHHMPTVRVAVLDGRLKR